MGEANLVASARILLPRPTPKQVVDHSPTPSSVRIAASSNGDGKEGAGGVRLVVIGEHEATAVADRRARCAFRAADAAFA